MGSLLQYQKPEPLASRLTGLLPTTDVRASTGLVVSAAQLAGGPGGRPVHLTFVPADDIPSPGGGRAAGTTPRRGRDVTGRRRITHDDT